TVRQPGWAGGPADRFHVDLAGAQGDTVGHRRQMPLQGGLVRAKHPPALDCGLHRDPGQSGRKAQDVARLFGRTLIDEACRRAEKRAARLYVIDIPRHSWCTGRLLINFGMPTKVRGKLMCAKRIVDLLKFDTPNEMRDALQQYKERLETRQAEIRDVLRTVYAKLGLGSPPPLQ